jgi:ABC-type nitrate/sulfonate/bicarbonate transport system substrate-binding protein
MTSAHRFPALAVALLGAAVAFLPATASAQQQTPATVTLALPGINIAFLSFYMADDLHLWSDQGLQVKSIMLQGAASTNALIAGSVEFAVSSGSSITRAWAHGQKLHAVATAITTPLEWVMIRKDVAEAEHFDPNAPLAERAKILRGKKMAIGGVASLPDAVLKAVAAEAGIPPGDVIAAPMQPPEFLAAWKSKQIDGFSNSMPYTQQVLLDGSGVMVSDAVKGEPTRFSPIAASMLMVRAEYCVDHAAVCTTMLHSLVAAIRVMEDDPARAMASMKAHFGGYDEKVLEAAYEALKAVTANPPLTSVQELENGDLMNEAVGFLKSDEKLADYAPLIDNSFVK